MIEPLAQARMRTCGVFRFCMCVVSDYCVLGLLLTDGDFDARHCEVSSFDKISSTTYESRPLVTRGLIVRGRGVSTDASLACRCRVGRCRAVGAGLPATPPGGVAPDSPHSEHAFPYAKAISF